MFGKRSKATSAVMAGLLAVGMAASPLAPAVAFAANSASVGDQTGSGRTDLTMILKDTDEHGGTAESHYLDDGTTPNPLYNPDADGDGLGDNLAFTVPASINYVVDADGTMTGPTNASIQNRSVMGINVSSVDVDEETPFKIVSDATASTDANSVDLEFGPAEDQLNAADYLTKTDVADASKWEMGAEGAADANLGIETDGHVSHVAKDITQQSKFGTIKWYLKATHKATESNKLINGYDFNNLLHSFNLGDNAINFKNLAVVKAAPDTVNGKLVSDTTGDFPVYATSDAATGTITLTSEADEIVLNEDCSLMFADFNFLTSLDASRFDTSRVTNMSQMFMEAALLQLDCSSWDVSNVTDHHEFNFSAEGVIPPNWVN
jgi:surface protein